MFEYILMGMGILLGMWLLPIIGMSVIAIVAGIASMFKKD